MSNKNKILIVVAVIAVITVLLVYYFIKKESTDTILMKENNPYQYLEDGKGPNEEYIPEERLNNQQPQTGPDPSAIEVLENF